ncbi:CMGC/CDK/CDK7 protein kinase [Vittaforma corneae ATCC 50505]|uniref:[RNA-polymerase]-subunit kinase n=1 Tax=Vittaforma corneae (strain ATCC 50505) TaxID=993615 RepID=L2GJR4_VITCO|nr:CMGC/CDK/CDK7 protein kinase [Vittaforma corneae ATCC 50505]ELA41103.1 CMGC/CDK/CDK7 protein kinase [Vittaforma corneae ATCC 50505]
MSSYFKCKKLGEGTYAVIYLAKMVEQGDSKLAKTDPTNFVSYVAIKKIKKTEHSTGQEISAIREIKALKRLKSPYILELKECFIHKGFLHLVLEFCEFDLEQVVKNKSIVILPSDIKSWMFMLLSGLLECHKNFFIHRDVKPNNCLIKADGTLKLADFGLTRKLDGKMTEQAITRWYRSPEMLLGAQAYSFAADMWSVGAVFAEMFLRVPFFAAENDFQQMELIFKALGTPDENEWSEIRDLPGYFEYQPTHGTSLEQLFSAASDDALDLLKRLLVFNPNKRITCVEALGHRYFLSDPPATPIGKLPVPLNEENRSGSQRVAHWQYSLK